MHNITAHKVETLMHTNILQASSLSVILHLKGETKTRGLTQQGVVSS